MERDVPRTRPRRTNVMNNISHVPVQKKVPIREYNDPGRIQTVRLEKKTVMRTKSL